MNSELQRDIDLFVEISEKWKHDHEEVMASYSFENLLEKGVALFDSIVGSEERWRLKIYRGEVQYSEEGFAVYTDSVKHWLATGEQLLQSLKHFENAGFFVKHAKEFRRCLREAQGILTPDDKFFSDDPLVEERDRAIDEARPS
jgi:hypothetical protein